MAYLPTATISAAYYTSDPIGSELNYTPDYLMCLGESNRNTLNFQNRVQVYKDIVQNVLSSFADVFETSKLSVNLKARPLGICINDGDFSTRTAPQYALPAYNRMKDFFDQALDSVMSSRTESMVLYDLGNFDAVFNHLSAFNTTIGTYDIDTSQQKTIPADIQQVLIELKSLMIELSKIKQFNANYVFYQTNINTEFIGRGTDPQRACAINPAANGTIAQIFTSPYKTIIQPSELPNIILHRSSQAFNEKTSVINFNNIIKSEDAFPEKLQTFPLTDEGSNGVLSYTTHVEETHFDLNEKIDIEEMFGLKKGEIISRKQLLKALDYIFLTWIKNIQYITYVTTICHGNCHTNTFIKPTLLTALNEIYSRSYKTVINLYFLNALTKYTDSQQYDAKFRATIAANQVKNGESTFQDSTRVNKVSVKAYVQSLTGNPQPMYIIVKAGSQELQREIIKGKKDSPILEFDLDSNTLERITAFDFETTELDIEHAAADDLFSAAIVFEVLWTVKKTQYYS